jgi:acetyl-CoA carboxylase carboxyltransferase component
VVTGNAIGASYVAMGGKAIADVCYAWPTAMVAPVTKQVAVAVFENEKLDAGVSREELENEYAEKTGALNAAENALVDEVIDPQDTRKVIINALEFLYSKRDVNPPKKHGNMPL